MTLNVFQRSAKDTLILSVASHLHVVKDFEEGEGHAATNDHLIDLIQHVVDQLYLIFYLRPETQSERVET